MEGHANQYLLSLFNLCRYVWREGKRRKENGVEEKIFVSLFYSFDPRKIFFYSFFQILIFFKCGRKYYFNLINNFIYNFISNIFFSVYFQSFIQNIIKEKKLSIISFHFFPHLFSSLPFSFFLTKYNVRVSSLFIYLLFLN